MERAGGNIVGRDQLSSPVHKPPSRAHMIPEKVHPIEDAFHRIQTPMPVSAGHPPTDDEPANAVRIELWNAGFRQHEFEVAVSDLGLTISGAVPSEALRKKAIEAAHKATTGRLLDEIAVADTGAASNPGADAPQKLAEPGPAVYVARYCSLDPASIGAGVRSAELVLEAFLSEQRIKTPIRDTLLIFRNVLSETVTIEVGCAVPAKAAKAARGQTRSGRCPSGPDFSLPISGDGHALATTIEALRSMALERGMAQPAFFWQRLPDPHHPWPSGVPVLLHAAWK